MRTTRAALWTLADEIISQGGGFLIFLLLTRAITPGDYGIFTVAVSVMTIPGIILYQGFGEAIIQRSEVDDVHLSTAFWTDVCIALILMLLIYVLSFASRAIFGSEAVGSAMCWLSLTYLFRAIVNVPLALFRRHLNMEVFALRTSVGAVAGLSVGLLMAGTRWGVWSLIGYQLTQSATIAFVIWIRSHWRPKLTFSLKAFRELLGFSAYFMAASTMNAVTDRLDNLLIGAFLGLTAVGYYSFAMRLLQAATILSLAPISRIVVPVVSRLKGDPIAIRYAYSKMVIAGTAIWVPVTLTLYVAAPVFVPLVFGQHWSDAVPLLRLLCLGSVALALLWFTGQTLSAVGRPDLYAGSMAVQLIFSVIAYGIGVQFDIIAVGYSCIALSAAMIPIHLYLINKIVRPSFLSMGGTYLRVLSSGGIMLICMVTLSSREFDRMLNINYNGSHAVLGIMVAILVGSAVYVVLLVNMIPFRQLLSFTPSSSGAEV